MNATNILAQKYFRGTLGTMEREVSLRQVIDRVADTITTWGVKDGYFADAVEASAFSDELKYLIANQRAAFNSPVWFNIGVSGVPQQASACFILSVEDSMSSILNLYVEEGTIFKGGSGSGVNLSRIRGRVALGRRRNCFWSGELHAWGRCLSGHHQVWWQDPAGSEDGDSRRRPSDVREFIWCKAREERKARALAAAGFDLDLDSVDSHSIQYQNANNSVSRHRRVHGGRCRRP